MFRGSGANQCTARLAYFICRLRSTAPACRLAGSYPTESAFMTPHPLLDAASSTAADVPLNEPIPASLPSGLRHAAQPGPLQQVQAASGYAGDVSVQLAYQWQVSGEAVLVDVRTDAEREWVGFVPGAVALAWKQWPGMAPNSGFDAALQAAVPSGKKVALLCRSGVRSVAAAKRATELGMEAYNILEGFEGDPDANGQRGRQGGWRFNGLPWRQS